jgi:hypothetical protein
MEIKKSKISTIFFSNTMEIKESKIADSAVECE